MTRAIKILTLLAVMMIVAGQSVWADAPVNLSGWGYNVVGDVFPDALDGTKGMLDDGDGHTIPFVVHNFEQVTDVGTDHVTTARKGSILIDPEDYANKPAGIYTGTVNGITLSLHIEAMVEPIVVTQANINEIFCGVENPTDVISQYCLGSQIHDGAILDFQGNMDKNRSLVINKKVGIFSSTKNATIDLHTVINDSENGIPKFSFIVSTGASGSIIKDLFINNCQTWIYNVSDVLLKDMIFDVRSAFGLGEGTGHTAVRYCDHLVMDGCNVYTNNTNAPCMVFYVVNRSSIINTTIEGQSNIGSLLTLECPNELFSDAPSANYVATSTKNTIKNCFIKTGYPDAVPIANENADHTTFDNIQVHASKNIQTGANATVINSRFYGSCGIGLGENSSAYSNVVHGSSSQFQNNSNVYNNIFNDLKITNPNVTFTNNTVTNKLTINSPATIKDNYLGEVSIESTGYSMSNNIEKITTLTNNIIRGKVTVKAKKTTISNNTIVTTGDDGVIVQKEGVVVKDNIIVCANRTGNDAVSTNQTDTEISGNTGGTPLTAATATLEAADGISKTYYVPVNTTVSIDGGLTVTPVDGANSPKTSIILCEGARLTVGSGMAADGVQLDIVGPGALRCGDIACKELTVNSGKITVGDITATDKISLKFMAWADYIHATNYIAPTVATTAASSDLFLFDETGMTDIVTANGDVDATTIAGKTLRMASYGGIADVNVGRNLVWYLTDADDGTLAVGFERNIKEVNAGQTDFRMMEYGSVTATWRSYNPTFAYLGTGVTNVESDEFCSVSNFKLFLTPTEADYAACCAAATSDGGNGWNQEVNGRTYLSMLAPRSLTVTKNASGWATFCHNYPRKFRLSEGTMHTITGLSNDGKSVTTAAVDGNLVAPGVPLLLNFSGTGTITLTPDPDETATAAADALISTTSTGWTFYGNAGYDAIAANDATFIKVNDCDIASYVLRSGQFVRVDKNDGLAAHRCVLNVSSNTNAPVLAISTDVTGVKEVVKLGVESGVKKDDSWYSLDGRKLNAAPTRKGVYIRNGVKVVVK